MIGLDWQTVLAGAGLAIAGLNGGVFFAFSTFVMPALATLPSPQATSTMQAINTAAYNPGLLTTLFGSALVGAPLVIDALGSPVDMRLEVALGALLASVATLAITALFHVPRNNALGELDPSTDSTALRWAEYLPSWTRGNHGRTATSTISAVLYGLLLGL